jgi:hypothetical protein
MWSIAVVPFLAGHALAAYLYASHYSGTISLLTLDHVNGAYSLTQTATATGCGTLPAWITLDTPGAMLYCTDENFSGTASISSFSVDANWRLTARARASTPTGGVANCLYGGTNGTGYIASAH